MNKGVSDTFEDQEQDTAKRGVPSEIAERAKRTTKMKSVDLDQLVRGESGTRPAVTPAEIEQLVRSQMQQGLVEPDPHSRPTIEAVAFHSTHPQEPHEPTLPVAVSSLEPIARETSPLTITPTPVRPSATTSAPITPQAPPTHVAIPRWLLTVMIVGAIVLIAAAGAFGFAAGRLTL